MDVPVSVPLFYWKLAGINYVDKVPKRFARKDFQLAKFAQARIHAHFKDTNEYTTL